MTIYRLTTTDDAEFRNVRWASYANYAAGDAITTCVVRARSEAEARKTAAEFNSSEDPKAWLDPTTVVEVISEHGSAEFLG